MDTSALLWFVSSGARLGARASDILENPDTSVLLSLASIWELAIKANLGRNLQLPLPFPELVEDILKEDRMQLLSINVAHLKQVADLLPIHRDPFDRLIIAQSLVENLPIITNDSAFDAYPTQRIW